MLLRQVEGDKIRLMGEHPTQLTRRAFLKLAGANLAALAFRIPGDDWDWQPQDWPALELEQLAPQVRQILSLVPKLRIQPDGYLVLLNEDGSPSGSVPHVRTVWNQERCGPRDRLKSGLPWAIVLHWYGDKPSFDKTIAGYLRGFDSLRKVAHYITRTSAHFVVADEPPSTRPPDLQDSVGILQTQAPDPQGYPYLGSHLKSLDYLTHYQRRQYFVRAYYQLGYREPRVHSVLQDYFDGHIIDPNQYTIAIEIAGFDFEHAEHTPGPQQIANVLGVVTAVMKRYGITANNILGHHEIQLGKPDPGKKFMTLVRYLLGVKALVDRDYQMKRLVFGQFSDAQTSPDEAVQAYFKMVRDYLVLVGTQKDVYEWEAMGSYWITHSLLSRVKLPTIKEVRWPLDAMYRNDKLQYLEPENHEGVDLLAWQMRDLKPGITKSAVARLLAEGTCLFSGENDRCNPGRTAIFSHFQSDGAQILTVYSNLAQMSELHLGARYPAGFPLGSLESSRYQLSPSLHLAVAYGATWDTDLNISPTIPINAGTNWIQRRYLHPLDYFGQYTHLPG